MVLAPLISFYSSKAYFRFFRVSTSSTMSLRVMRFERRCSTEVRKGALRSSCGNSLVRRKCLCWPYLCLPATQLWTSASRRRLVIKTSKYLRVRRDMNGWARNVSSLIVAIWISPFLCVFCFLVSRRLNLLQEPHRWTQ